MPMLVVLASLLREVTARKPNPLCSSNNARMIIRMQTALAVLVAMGHLVVLAMSATARDAGKLSDPFLDVKRPADQDTYDAYVSGKKSLVTSFQVTPVIATNAECIEKGKNCEWREVGIHERASGFVMLRNNANFKDPSHNFAFSCIICGTELLSLETVSMISPNTLVTEEE